MTRLRLTAATLVLISLTGLIALPCVCAAEAVATRHGCCAPRTSIHAADSCCPSRGERPMAAAPSTVFALSSETTAFLPGARAAVLPSTVLPRRIACARTPILRI